jgi:hypothetical protein
MMGQATSAAQFFRQIGGAIAASILGTVFTLVLIHHLPGELSTVNLNTVGEGGAAMSNHTVNPAMKTAFTEAISKVYLCNIFLVAGGLIITLFLPDLPLRKSNEVVAGING